MASSHFQNGRDEITWGYLLKNQGMAAPYLAISGPLPPRLSSTLPSVHYHLAAWLCYESTVAAVVGRCGRQRDRWGRRQRQDEQEIDRDGGRAPKQQIDGGDEQQDVVAKREGSSVLSMRHW